METGPGSDGDEELAECVCEGVGGEVDVREMGKRAGLGIDSWQEGRLAQTGHSFMRGFSLFYSSPRQGSGSASVRVSRVSIFLPQTHETPNSMWMGMLSLSAVKEAVWMHLL